MANKCKYCGKETTSKDMCKTCRDRYPLVQELIEIGEPLRQSSKARKERKNGRG